VAHLSAQIVMHLAEPRHAHAAGGRRHLRERELRHPDTGSPISYGVSVNVNEMCNVQTRVYPVPELQDGSFTCF